MTIAEDNHFRASFNPWIGLAFITAGLLIFLLTLRAMLASSTFSFRLIVGILLIAVGSLYLKRPYFAIAPNRLTVYSFFGQVVKRYPFASFSDIEISGSNVYIKPTEAGDRPEKTKIHRWITRPADWKKLQQLAE